MLDDERKETAAAAFRTTPHCAPASAHGVAPETFSAPYVAGSPGNAYEQNPGGIFASQDAAVRHLALVQHALPSG